MFVMITMYDDYYGDYSTPDEVTVYDGINTQKEFDKLSNEYSKLFKKVEETRKSRKIRKSLANSHRLMEELGIPKTFDEFLLTKGVTYEKVEFTTT